MLTRAAQMYARHVTHCEVCPKTRSGTRSDSEVQTKTVSRKGCWWWGGSRDKLHPRMCSDAVLSQGRKQREGVVHEPAPNHNPRQSTVNAPAKLPKVQRVSR